MNDIQPYTQDEDLLAATLTDGQPRLRITRCKEPVVVIGRGGDPEVELQLDAISEDGVPVRRRRGGGCAVVLDPGNVVLSLVLPEPGLGGIKTAFASISQWLNAALTRIGLPGVEQHGVSDLVLNGKKIGGSCIYRARGLLYYSTTLLIDPDLVAVERYLKHPPREPEYRRGRAHAEFMGALGPLLGELGRAAFVQALEGALRLSDPGFLSALSHDKQGSEKIAWSAVPVLSY